MYYERKYSKLTDYDSCVINQERHTCENDIYRKLQLSNNNYCINLNANYFGLLIGLL